MKLFVVNIKSHLFHGTETVAFEITQLNYNPHSQVFYQFLAIRLELFIFLEKHSITKPAAIFLQSPYKSSVSYDTMVSKKLFEDLNGSSIHCVEQQAKLEQFKNNGCYTVSIGCLDWAWVVSMLASATKRF